MRCPKRVIAGRLAGVFMFTHTILYRKTSSSSGVTRAEFVHP
jgi:hypothetical protein